MEKYQQSTLITQKSEAKWPTNLKKAWEVATLLGIEEDRINTLANAHYIPHWRIDGGEPLFHFPEVKKWASENLLNRVEGNNLPIELRLMVNPPEAGFNPPLEIVGLENLRSIPIHNYPPGVYFLVKGDEVVYVGQSKNPLARVGTHRGDKVFDRAYMLPVPDYLLDAVEGAIIRLLNPLYNGGIAKVATGRGLKEEDDWILSEFAKGLRAEVDA